MTRTAAILKSFHYKMPIETFADLTEAIIKLEQVELRYMDGFDWCYDAYSHFVELAEKIVTILTYVETNIDEHAYDL
jgi:hypothetical protein